MFRLVLSQSSADTNLTRVKLTDDADAARSHG
jgi:hypothetical protein